MPCLSNNTFYKLNTVSELLDDLKKSLTLSEVSEYLKEKVEASCKDY